jgi:hypothetical protein
MTRQRILLIVLLAWALVMIVPDVLRVVQPLGSFGFYADNDGMIYDVTGPFDAESDSPAWKAGIRDGDKLALSKLRCFPCTHGAGRSSARAAGPRGHVRAKATGDHPARQVTLKAAPVPANPFERFIVLIDQIAGILVVIAAAWLVWTRPGAMSWGFFLYVIWFNPGQFYAFYALLQQQPLLLLAQNLASAIAEAVGYVGLILFVLRAPDGEPDRKWRWLERALPVIGGLLALLMLFTYGNLTGYRTETGTRFSILVGFLVAVCAVAILLERTRRKPPEDYQRMRWVVWGCLIGLPAFLLADLASTTTIFETRWENFTPSEDVIGLLYLVNGILCLFVFEAVRRERVVSVSIPLRRVTILGLTLSIPALLLHHEVEYMQQHLAIPNWAWIVIGAGALYLISRLHEGATHLTDRYFNRDLDKAERTIAAAILKAKGCCPSNRTAGSSCLPPPPSAATAPSSDAIPKAMAGARRRRGTCRPMHRCSHRWRRAFPSLSATRMTVSPTCQAASAARFWGSRRQIHCAALPCHSTGRMLRAPTSIPTSVPC